MLGGAIVGLAGQAVDDVVAGKMSGWEDYVGSIVGGWSLLYTGPVGARAASEAISNLVKQILKMLQENSQGMI